MFKDLLKEAELSGAAHALHVLYSLGYDIPDEYYSTFLEDARKVALENGLVPNIELMRLQPRKTKYYEY